ncbi:PHP domain-containing protein, partial [Streptomyces sp. SM12]
MADQRPPRNGPRGHHGHHGQGTVLPLRPNRTTSSGGPPADRWAELHAHSSFSFLQGASSPGELAVEAARLGIGVLALTDRDGLYGARRLAEAAAAAGISTVYGAELTLETGQGLPAGR